jgi:hypothetical protein
MLLEEFFFFLVSDVVVAVSSDVLGVVADVEVSVPAPVVAVVSDDTAEFGLACSFATSEACAAPWLCSRAVVAVLEGPPPGLVVEEGA